MIGRLGVLFFAAFWSGCAGTDRVMVDRAPSGPVRIATNIDQTRDTSFSDDFPKVGVTYRVRAGDTLPAIAARHKSNIRDIVNANRISNPSELRVGWVMFIPQHEDAGRRVSNQANVRVDPDPAPKSSEVQASHRRSGTFLWQPDDRNHIWVLVVGVAEYRNPSVPGLPFARKDAERIRDWFSANGLSGAKGGAVRVLLDEQATRVNVLDQIDRLRREALPEDAVIVYFAGHGAPEVASDGTGVDAKYLLLYDTNPDQLFSTGFSLDELKRRLETIKAKVQLVVLEACYTGPVGREVLGRTPTADLEVRPRLIQEMGQESGRVILSASSGRQVAMGWDEIDGGVFTHHLLHAWGDGTRGLLSEGFEDARESVRRAANRLGSTQEPQKFGDENIDILLKRR